MWHIQGFYNSWGQLDSLWEVPLGDYVGLWAVMLSFMAMLPAYRAIGWFWKQNNIVHDIWLECLRYDSTGLGDVEKKKRVGLSAREELEWWIWDVLKDETGPEIGLNREARMVWLVKDIVI